MTLPALQHLVRSAQVLAEDRHILVLGSASLLASFPDLGTPGGPLAATYDADLCPEPFDELTGRMLDQALGEHRAYHERHGYHADILRDDVLETIPAGWRERLVLVPGTEGCHALDPHDLAAIKLLVGRPKDLGLVRFLQQAGRIDPSEVWKRLQLLSLPAANLAKADRNFRETFSS